MTQKSDEMLAGLENQVIERVGRPSGPELLFSRQQWKFMGRMTNASCTGKLTGKCGETMEIYLRIEGECIREASFYTDGCGASKACASMAVELATGKDIDEAALIGGDTLLEALKDLPECHRHCAHLAAETLHEAIHQWMLKPVKALCPQPQVSSRARQTSTVAPHGKRQG
jgi:nitrogen fixation NifU-like protein